MPDPLFCPLQDRGEKPGHVIRVVPEVKEEQENAAVAAPASAEHRPMWSSQCRMLGHNRLGLGPCYFAFSRIYTTTLPNSYNTIYYTTLLMELSILIVLLGDS